MGQAGSSTAFEERVLHRLSGHENHGVRFVSVGPDGDTLATCSADGTIKLWSITTAKLLRTLTGHDAEVTACCFSGPLMATSALDKLVILWHHGTGKRAAKLAMHSGRVFHCAFSPDGKTLASVSEDRTTRLYPIKPGAGEFVPGNEIEVLYGHCGAVNVVQFLPDNNEVLFTGSEDGTVMVWERGRDARWHDIRQINIPFGRVKSLRFWPNEPFFATLSGTHIGIWSVTGTNKMHSKLEVRSERPLEAFAFSPDGKYVVGVCSDSKVHVWEPLLKNAKPIMRQTDHEGGIQACCFDPQGNHFITADNHGETVIWIKEQGGRLFTTVKTPQTGRLFGLVMEFPIIDIAPLMAGESAESDEVTKVVAQMRAACKDLTCFYITGHGISTAAMENILEYTRKFFSLPTEKKNAMKMSKTTAYRGYIQFGTEKTNREVDVKEGVYFGRDGQDIQAGKPMVGPNQFPTEHDLPGFSEVVNSYRSQMVNVGHAVMHGLALSLGLKKDIFDSLFDPPFPLLAMWHYPPLPGKSNSWGVGPHTDYGVLTILLQDDVGGLQVEVAEGDWVYVPPVPGTFVINVGDVVQAWSGGAYRSTWHRVKNSPLKDRVSAPFFFQPNEESQIAPLEALATHTDSSALPVLSMEMPFKFGDYVLQKFKASYGE